LYGYLKQTKMSFFNENAEQEGIIGSVPEAGATVRGRRWGMGVGG
jgi:hypothetical protein